MEFGSSSKITRAFRLISSNETSTSEVNGTAAPTVVEVFAGGDIYINYFWNLSTGSYACLYRLLNHRQPSSII